MPKSFSDSVGSVGTSPCLRRSNHLQDADINEHLIQNKNGSFALWKQDEKCGPEGGDECLIYIPITAGQAEEILRRDKEREQT
jgi:hypothetical protein